MHFQTTTNIDNLSCYWTIISLWYIILWQRLRKWCIVIFIFYACNIYVCVWNKKKSGYIESVHLLVSIFSLSVNQTFLSQALSHLENMACTFNINSPISNLTVVTVDQCSRVLHLWNLLCRQGAWFGCVSNTHNCCFIWNLISDKWHQIFLKSFWVMIEQNVGGHIYLATAIRGTWRNPQSDLTNTIWFIWWFSYMYVAYLDRVYSIRAFHFVRNVVSFKCIFIVWQTVS